MARMLKPNPHSSDEGVMRHCLTLAEQSAAQGEYPYAAVVVRDGKIVAQTTNRVAQERDVTRHAELVAISLAQQALGCTDLADCTIYANFEPCALCCYAIRESRIGKVVFSMRSPVMGGVSRWNILGDRTLSDTMPEVFAPPPAIVAEFLCEEASAVLRRSTPMAWAFMRSRGLLSLPSPQQAGGNYATPRPVGLTGATEWIMRILRRNFFDRFGRGGGKRRARRGENVRPSP